MIPREPKKAQLPWSDIAVFTGAVAFLFFSVHSFLGAKVQHPSVAPPPATLERAPASQASLPAPTGTSTQVLHLPCLLTGPQSATTNARLMQIHSQPCAKLAPGTQWKATNSTSGEEILVFVNAKDRTVSTNYFNLREGRNTLEFTLDLGAGGVKRQSVEVIRKAD